MANPFTLMRAEIQDALGDYEALAAVTMRKWDAVGQQRVDNPAADRTQWIRVETTDIEFDPDYSNSHAEFTHAMQVVIALPAQAGKKLQDIEELAYLVCKALTGLCRHDLGGSLGDNVELAAMVIQGGSIGLAESGQPKREDAVGNLVWSQVATATAKYHELISSLQA